MSARRPLGARRSPPASEPERRRAHEVAAFICEARRLGVPNDRLLMAIDRNWPNLRARTLIAAHFLDLGRRQGRAQ